MSLEGVDVSNNNGGALPPDVGFLFAKASEGASFDDKTFEGYVTVAQRDGIPWGPYHFAHPDANTAKAEAEWFLKNAQRGPLGWALDIETRGKISPLALMGAPALAGWCEAFRSIVEPELGRSFFYTFRSYAQVLFPELSDSWLFWLASGKGVPTYETYAGREVAIEQYGQADGFDRNIAHLPLVGPTAEDDMNKDQDAALFEIRDAVRTPFEKPDGVRAIVKEELANHAAGNIDLDALADKVADKLAARLKD